MTTNFDVSVHSDLPIAPGELLGEELKAAGMTQRQFAALTGRPVQAISEIIHGKKSITPYRAIKFEKVLGIPAQMGLNLEATYQLA
jgi:addiction module HigA family antidote